MITTLKSRNQIIVQSWKIIYWSKNALKLRLNAIKLVHEKSHATRTFVKRYESSRSKRNLIIIRSFQRRIFVYITNIKWQTKFWKKSQLQATKISFLIDKLNFQFNKHRHDFDRNLEWFDHESFQSFFHFSRHLQCEEENQNAKIEHWHFYEDFAKNFRFYQLILIFSRCEWHQSFEKNFSCQQICRQTSIQEFRNSRVEFHLQSQTIRIVDVCFSETNFIKH